MFDDVLPIVPQDDGSFRAQADESWLQGRGVYGGLPAAWLAQAGAAAVGRPGRRLRTLTVHLAAPVPPRAVTARAREVRKGAHVSQVTGELVDGEDVLATMVATFGSDRPGLPDHSGPACPALPPPEGSPRMPSLPLLPAFARHHIDYRYAIGGMPYTASPAHLGGWARFDGGATPGVAMLVALSDVWPPALLPALDGPRGAATVDLTLHLHAPLADDASRDDLYAYEARITQATGGYAEERAHLWDKHGRCLMSVRQALVVFG